MDEQRSTYRFGPAHVSGAFGSPLSYLQVGVLLVGLYVAYRVFTSTGVAGVPVAIGLIGVTCVLVLVPMRGRELIEWLPIMLAMLARRVLGRDASTSSAPFTGFVGSARDPHLPGEPPDPVLPPSLKGIEIIAGVFERSPNPAAPDPSRVVGIIKDRRARTWSAVLKVRVGAFGLLSSDDQRRRVEAWSNLLTSLCREGTPISRLQWLERTIPTDPGDLVEYHLTHRDQTLDREHSVVRAYEELLDDSIAATQDHELLLVVQVSMRRAKHLIHRLADDPDTGACLLLGQELQTLADDLLACDIEPVGVLRPGTIGKLIRLAYDPFQRTMFDQLAAVDPTQDGVSAVNAFPLATRATWRHYQTDGALHATYWVASMPQRAVPVGFLVPLLLQANMQRSIAMVLEPLESSKALSSLEAAIVGNQTSEQFRAAKGFAQTARRAKKSHDLIEREAELASGFGEFRYSAYVTVSALTPDELEHACAALENRALQSRLQLRRLNGMHDTAFRSTLPIGHGLHGPGGAR